MVAEVNEQYDDFTLLPAIEVDITEEGKLDQTKAMLEQLDIVVASVHSKLRADSKTMTHRMVGGIANRYTNVLGHCTGRLVEGGRGTRPPSTFDAEVVFAACAQFDVAVEINSRPGAARSAVGADPAGDRGRLPVLDRHRCPCAGAAGVPGLRVRAGGGQRRTGRPDRQHLATGPAARVEPRQALSVLTAARRLSAGVARLAGHDFDSHRRARTAVGLGIQSADWLAFGAAGLTVVAWASAFVAIRSTGETFSPGALALGRLIIGSARARACCWRCAAPG